MRLRQDNELVVMSSAGQGLHRLLAPALALAVILTATAILILGYLNPHARYAYRALKNSVAEASLNAAVREGTFIQADNLTFFAEGSAVGSDGLQLSKVFVYEESDNGASIVTTGAQGLLGQEAEDTGTILKLKDGVRAELPAGDSNARTLTFSDLSWPVATSEVAEFRPRGRDQRELTLPELWAAQPTADSHPDAAEITAELNARLVIVATVPLLPLLAASLALLGTIRGERRAAVFIGLVILIVYYETLSFGEALVKNGMLPPQIALWLPFLCLAGATACMYARASLGRWPRLHRRPQRFAPAG
jgi:lipopolysaccharide export system permease protein